MKILVKFFVVAILLVGATTGFGFGQGMVYQTHQEMSLASGEGLSETWVQLSSNDYVRATHNGTNSVVETSGWTVNIQGGYWPCIAQYNDTIWCAVRQTPTSTVVVGSFTFSPTGTGTVVLIKISSSGSVLNAWQASGSMSLVNIAIKNNSEIAVVGTGGTVLEHLTSPDGGGVVLIHNGTDWDTTKGFFIEAPSGGSNPAVLSAQYLPNGNLAIAGYTDGGTVSFGGISLPAHGLEDGFRGEITSTGVGISAVQMAGGGRDYHTLQITKADGSFMVTGTYSQPITFYNADGTSGGSLSQHPAGASHDHVYFAYYNASGVFQSASVAYNNVATTDLNNIDLVYGNDAFYTMIDCQDGGTSIMPSGEQYQNPAPIILKFDDSGVALWAKQFQKIGTNSILGYGEEILVSADTITLTGTEFGTCDLDFNSGVVSISSTSYWCEYFDGIVVGPIADFSGTPVNGYAPLNVQFTDSSTMGTNPITSWSWDFGDGGTSSVASPLHTYATAGTYTVSLIVSDGTLSDTEVKTNYFSVYDSLVADAGSDIGLELGQSTQFDGAYRGGSGDVTILWEGVNNSIPIDDPSILDPTVGPFSDMDVYYFALTVTDNITGCIETDTILVNVVTGIIDNDINKIKIYPNPTAGNLFINAQERLESVSIMNISGREVFHQENLGKDAQIDLSALPSGTYFVNVRFTSGNIIKKINKK